jgi:hypothetical protein
VRDEAMQHIVRPVYPWHGSLVSAKLFIQTSARPICEIRMPGRMFPPHCLHGHHHHRSNLSPRCLYPRCHHRSNLLPPCLHGPHWSNRRAQIGNCLRSQMNFPWVTRKTSGMTVLIKGSEEPIEVSALADMKNNGE